MVKRMGNVISEVIRLAKKKLKGFLDIVITFIVAFAIMFLISRILIINTSIVSGSMLPQVTVGSRVVGSRLAYRNNLPERGDVIIFAFPDDESQTYIKRIIGLPGETVEIISGSVYINDEVFPLQEPYLAEAAIGHYGPYEVPDGCYFVLGDNRNHSVDSREWNNKFVALEKIYAKALFSYYPEIKEIN